MADIEVEIGGRFPGDFSYRFTAGYQAKSSEIRLKDNVDELCNQLENDVKKAKSEASDPYLLKSIFELIEDIIQPLRGDADICETSQTGTARDDAVCSANDNLFYYKGIYVDRSEFIFRRPFTVLPLKRDPQGLAIRPLEDIEIKTRDVSIPDSMQKFKVDLDNTCRIVKIVCSQSQSDPIRGTLSKLGLTFQTNSESSAWKLDRYLYPLLEISKIGLMNQNPSQATFATLALKGLQQEFVDREAGRVKNSYVARLGGWAACVFVLGIIAFYVLGNFEEETSIFRYRRFYLLASGAALGTWLSFSLRRVTLNFSDLAVLEDDRLNPGVRVVFVVLLTIVVGLLFWTHAITVKIGDFSSDFRMNGAFALLIGVLCGIAERGLATAVGRRASDFVSGVGGN